MKKISVFLILFLISLSLWAQEEVAPEPAADQDTSQESTEENETPPPKKKKPTLKNRGFELSLTNVDLNFSNSFLSANDVIYDPIEMIKTGKFFRDSVSINLNEFFGGFTFLFGTTIKPLSLNINWKDKWGFGLDIGHINVTGNLLLSGNLLSFNEVSDDKLGAGAAVFADVGIPVFFHYNELKIKIRPSVFLPVVYTEPNITYSYRQVIDPITGDSGMRFQVNYDMRVFSIVDMRGFGDNDFDAIGQNLQDNAWDIARNNLGYDISLGLEYPLYDWLDLGVDITNIPLVMANLNHYMQIDGEVYVDTGKIDIASLVNGNEFPKDAFGYPEDMEIKYNNDGSVKIYRPFTMLFYAKCRPFESPVFSLIPSLGFSLNPLYTQLGSIEGGLSARLDLSNIFITTIGINYNDRKWKDSLDFVLNLRAFELDVGVSFQSSDFVKSFKAAGLGVNVGLKFGW
jgi:hypothetical protein